MRTVPPHPKEVAGAADARPAIGLMPAIADEDDLLAVRREAVTKTIFLPFGETDGPKSLAELLVKRRWWLPLGLAR
jgi:hypothetical protein